MLNRLNGCAHTWWRAARRPLLIPAFHLRGPLCLQRAPSLHTKYAVPHQAPERPGPAFTSLQTNPASYTARQSGSRRRLRLTDVFPSEVTERVHPVLRPRKCCWDGGIEDDHCSVGISKVPRLQSLESLLPGCVPDKRNKRLEWAVTHATSCDDRLTAATS